MTLIIVLQQWKIHEHPMKIDDLGVTPFSDTPILWTSDFFWGIDLEPFEV